MARKDRRSRRTPAAAAELSSDADVAAVLSALHGRVLLGDVAAGEELAARTLPWLRRRLRGAFRHVGDDVVNDAAEDAILELLTHPERFDPSKGLPFDRFIYIVAWRRLANQLRNAVARARREWDYVALRARDESLDTSDARNAREPADLLRRVLAGVPDRRERRALLG